MNTRFTITAVLGLLIGARTSASAATEETAIQAPKKGTLMTAQASGTFDVKVVPLPTDEKVPGLTVGRMSVDKQWKGDIEGTSKGEMMTTGSEAVKGSGGYVAIEQVTAKVKGRAGTFTFIHQATMRQNADFNMSIKVVPDSGTGQLVGLSGTLTILIEGKNHSYTFDYTLPEAKPGS